MINLASEESGLCREFFEKADEKASQGIIGGLFGMRFPFISDGAMPAANCLSNDALFKVQSDVIRKLASEKSCLFVETTLDVNQWYAFRPSLPADKLSNINYGQKNEDNSNTKILKVNGIGNGYSNVFYFRRRGGEWKMYKYEDTSI